MKKLLLLAILGTTLISGMSYAAPRNCSYTPLQQVIRAARSESDIQKLLDDRVNLNVSPKCGGNVMQLATLRGNPKIFKKLLESGNLPLDEKVTNIDYPIAGAPKEIPLAFFVAYYAPRMDMMQLFIQAGANILETDSRGETILWYLDQNPVLRNTELSDTIMHQLLVSSTVRTSNLKETPVSSAKAKEDKNVRQDNKKPKKGSAGDLIESEPDNPYKPKASDELGAEDF